MLRYQDAQTCAKLFRNAIKSLNRASTKAARARALASLSQAGLWLWMLSGSNPDNLGKAFKTLVQAADGKPLAMYDELLMEAYERERREAFEGMKGLSFEYVTFKLTRKGLNKQLEALSEKKKIDGDPGRPTLRAALRRAKQLGLR